MRKYALGLLVAVFLFSSVNFSHSADLDAEKSPDAEKNYIHFEQRDFFRDNLALLYYNFSAEVKEEMPNFTQQDLWDESKFDVMDKDYFSNHRRRLDQNRNKGNPRSIQWLEFSKAPDYIKDPFYDAGQEFIEQFPIYQATRDWLRKFSINYALGFNLEDTIENKEPVLQTAIKIDSEKKQSFFKRGTIGFRFDPNQTLSVSQWQGGFYGQLETELFDFEFRNNIYLDRASFEMEMRSKRFFNNSLELSFNIENSMFGDGALKSSFNVSYYSSKAFTIEVENRYDNFKQDSSTLVLFKKTF